MKKLLLSTLLLVLAINPISGCSSQTPQPANPAPTSAPQPADDATPQDDIPPVDPIWDAMAKKQAYLDQVEKIRSGNNDAVSCQKVGHVFPRRIIIDTSHCNPVQLRAEQDAAHQQLFDKMVKTLRHQN